MPKFPITQYHAHLSFLKPKIVLFFNKSPAKIKMLVVIINFPSQWWPNKAFKNSSLNGFESSASITIIVNAQELADAPK